jgi:hypothetical protein
MSEEGGQRKYQADDADAQQRRIGRAEDGAAALCDACKQGDCGSDGDAGAQGLHDGLFALSVITFSSRFVSIPMARKRDHG